MSHLTTLINRVNNRLKFQNSGDRLLQQSISNLREYVEIWEDYTEEEKRVADELYEKYKHLVGENYQ